MSDVDTAQQNAAEEVAHAAEEADAVAVGHKNKNPRICIYIYI